MPAKMDLKGKKFNMLTVIEPSHSTYRINKNGKKIKDNFWKAKCDCGNDTVVHARNLLTKHTISCGCQRSNVVDISGKKFNRLIAIEHVGSSKQRAAKWRCVCDCGNESIVTANSLKSGNTKSCGCYIKEWNRKPKPKRRKYKNRPKYYSRWYDMKMRCYDESHRSYESYGGIGIKICDEWLNYDNYHDWIEQQPKPDERWEIDRINSSKGYSPSNCRIITAYENRYLGAITKWGKK